MQVKEAKLDRIEMSMIKLTCRFTPKEKQVVKVIWQMAAMPPHMDGANRIFQLVPMCIPHLPHACLGPPESISQTGCRSVQPLLQNSWQKVPILYNGSPLSLSKLSLCIGGSGPPSNTLFFGPTKSVTQMASRSVQSFLQGSWLWQTKSTNRLRNRPHYLIGNNRPHLHT